MACNQFNYLNDQRSKCLEERLWNTLLRGVYRVMWYTGYYFVIWYMWMLPCYRSMGTETYKPNWRAALTYPSCRPIKDKTGMFSVLTDVTGITASCVASLPGCRPKIQRYHMTSNLLYKSHLRRQYNCWSLRCSWSIACRRCPNYIFILNLTPGSNR